MSDKPGFAIMRRLLFGAGVLVVVAAIVAGALYWQGVLQLNRRSASSYEVVGVDVSTYQGNIDWSVLASQGVDFAFIKATEGSSFTDPKFKANWSGAQKAGVVAGAYHFFSFETPGARQAAWFIKNVPSRQGMLPPVVDVEWYNQFKSNHPAKQDVVTQLQDYLDALESFYGVKPIIYCTESMLRDYLGGFTAYPIWIRNVAGTPNMPARRAWTFWQYSSTSQLKGYKGSQKFIDMNVFHGSLADLDALRL